MKRLLKALLFASALAGLSGCGGDGQSGDGSQPVTNQSVPLRKTSVQACLAREAPFADAGRMKAEETVLKFAKAARDCGASESDLADYARGLDADRPRLQIVSGDGS